MLPNTPGPKLQPFSATVQRPKCEFIRYLGNGDHAHVAQVRINGKIYALKMFRYFTAPEITAGDPPNDWPLLQEQITPFACEARAYARLKEFDMEHVAVKCHGYVELDEETYGPILANMFAEQGLEVKDWYNPTLAPAPQPMRFGNMTIPVNLTEAQRIIYGVDRTVAPWPIKAIVKDFMPAGTPNIIARGEAGLNKQVANMMQDLLAIQSIGIASRDIKEDNYYNSKFSDFSNSWTVPNARLRSCQSCQACAPGQPDPLSPAPCEDASRCAAFGNRPFSIEGRKDYLMFDRLIEDWNRAHPGRRITRAGFNPYTQQKLKLRSSARVRKYLSERTRNWPSEKPGWSWDKADLREALGTDWWVLERDNLKEVLDFEQKQTDGQE